MDKIQELIEAGKRLYPEHHKIIDGDIYHAERDPDMGEVYWPVDFGEEYGDFMIKSINARQAIIDLYEENKRLHRLAYHKHGVSYQDLFTHSINMDDNTAALREENKRLRAALKKIAKPALGGKLQQQIAQQALKEGQDDER